MTELCEAGEDADARERMIGIVSCTRSDNLRSQAVMKRLSFIRQPSLDFTIPASHGTEWHGLVWAVPEMTGANVG
jgi:RimJ/RimL family protein N-acetyltransferase